MAGVSTCIKYSMFFFNFIFWLCGSIILGVSIWMRVSNDTAKQISEINIAQFYSAINVLIAVGAIIMVLGFLGCCGAMKESRCMLLLFFIGLLLILVIQITAGVLGVVYKSQVESTLKKEYEKLIPLNGQNKNFEIKLEEIQKEKKCCGLLNGYKDWATVPLSCNCDQDDSPDCTLVNNKRVWSKSCSTMLMDLLKDNLSIIIGIAFGLAVVEIFGLAFSMTLYCQIKNK